MGFYGTEPFTTASATYVWMGLDSPGAFIVEVEGDAPNYTSGIQLVRDPHFVGGLKIDVMGWTGPLGEGTAPYQVKGTFPGEFRNEIIVSGANGDQVVKVEQIPQTETEAYLKAQGQ
jgi:hypothetical protein